MLIKKQANASTIAATIKKQMIKMILFLVLDRKK